MSRRPIAAFLTLLIIGLLAYAAFKPAAKPEEGGKGGGDKATLVSVVKSEARDWPLTAQAQGTVSPLQVVDLRPQVSSTIKAIHFAEGEQVKAGQLLFILDERADAARLAQSQAQQQQSNSLLFEAERELARSRTLHGQGFLAQSAVDAAQAKVDSLKASQAVSRAGQQSAEVGLSYQRIVAPFAGLSGAVEVHPGSLVQPGMATPLVRLVQLDPIAVSFSLPEGDLARLLAARAQGPVKVVAESGKHTMTGELSLIDNLVDPASGTVLLKARFANPKQQLWPGAFVRISLDLGIARQAISLPVSAVQTGPDKQFVYLLQADQTVQPKTVKLAQVMTQDGKQFAIVEGLSAGATVVAEGGQNLRPGAKVKLAGKGK